MGRRRHALAVYFGLTEETDGERAQRERDAAKRSVLRTFVASLFGGAVAGLMHYWFGSATDSVGGSVVFGCALFLTFLIGRLWERRQALRRVGLDVHGSRK